MITEERVKVTFNNDLGNNDYVEVKFNLEGESFGRAFFSIWVTSGNGIIISPPTQTPGERSAIQFFDNTQQQVNNISNLGYSVTCSRVGKTITISNKSIGQLVFGDLNFENPSGVADDSVQFELEKLSDGPQTTGYETIQTRSPYHIFTPQTTKKLTTIDLWIYKGDRLLDVPNEPTYTLQSVNLSERNNFEVSELINDFIEQSFENSNYSTEGIWCKYRYKFSDDSSLTNAQISNNFYLYCLDGYTYFEEGVNPNTNQSVLISNNNIVIPFGYGLKLPISTDIATNIVQYDYDENFISLFNVSDLRGEDSNDKVYYFNVNTENIGTIYVYSPIENSSVINIRRISVDVLPECLYSPVKLTFQNKFGVLQDVWFNKRSETSIKVKDEKYQANLLDVAKQSYDVSAHQSRILTKNGNETMSLNTGFLPQSYNEVFKQLLLSRLVWVSTFNGGFPVVRACNIKTSSLKEKTVLNDKLINYSIKIEIANNIINTVR